MAELTKQDVVEIVSRVIDEKIMPIMATKDDLRQLATKDELASVRAEMATKEDLTKVRVGLLSRMDRMEGAFKEDLAAQEARLTVRFKCYLEEALEARDRRIMETLRQSAS